ncbi:MAG TPA: bifunctional diaminohydroxyphosphoribosylaminopyrimidine deaminase/5-amino-6-(5-phosphoribosylamino)uracil reductase, partial [Corynebacterium variabile]|nr:bifunctional diaminohydroxyphosphoribosylaminopyrimidine deaminase/5-amino-6-(5-phosphoribosylamino)uracil reductase [Corynebacterium variabile]
MEPQHSYLRLVGDPVLASALGAADAAGQAVRGTTSP